MSELFPMHIKAFEGDDVTIDETVLAEVTDFTKSGVCEVAFTLKDSPDTPRLYVRLPLAELIARGMAMCGTNDI